MEFNKVSQMQQLTEVFLKENKINKRMYPFIDFVDQQKCVDYIYFVDFT